MKIMLLGMNKLKFMPYANYYLHQLSQRGHELHLVMWNRDGCGDVAPSVPFVSHYFEDVMDDSIALSKKLTHMLKYRRFMKKAIRKVSPDCLVIMHSTTGFLLGKTATRRYEKKYIFDYRDVTYERLSFYRKAVSELVSAASVSFTSSDGFRKYLPSDKKILTTHNVSFPSNVVRSQFRGRKKEHHFPIRISFWGRIRHHELNRLIIESIGGDARFELHYYGLAQGNILELLQTSCDRFSNVFFHGEYEAIDTWKLALSTDLLHNLYDNSDKTTPLAMGNKYYDGLIYYLPQLCMSGSQMEKSATQSGVGYSCDPESKTFADDLVNYYQSIDFEAFSKCCDSEWKRIEGELDEANDAITEFLRSIK